MITENGGRVVGLDEPKLTHVVLDKRDTSRRIELSKKTSKYVPTNQRTKIVSGLTKWSSPKRRHLVISEYIRACIDEGTLLDEDGKCGLSAMFTRIDQCNLGFAP
jgi:DNA ligase 4